MYYNQSKKKIILLCSISYNFFRVILFKITQRPIYSIINNIDFIVILRFSKTKKSNAYYTKDSIKNIFMIFINFKEHTR